jgi:hypothetical protein
MLLFHDARKIEDQTGVVFEPGLEKLIMTELDINPELATHNDRLKVKKRSTKKVLGCGIYSWCRHKAFWPTN